MLTGAPPSTTTEEPIENPGFRDLDPNGVIEQPFWERYNRQLEFPISVAIAALVLSATIALYYAISNFGPPDKAAMPLNFAGGDDDEGDGSPGDGGAQDQVVGKPLSAAERDLLLKEMQLNEPKDLQEKLDFGGDVEIPENEQIALAQLDEALRKKLLGAKTGTGTGTSGGDPLGGKGPGGFGASSTYARALRWILRFDTSSGDDYVAQMSGIGGVVMVPVPPDNKNFLIFKNPRSGQSAPATDDDIQKYTKMIQFAEVRRDSVESVAKALKLTFTPKSFFAYFPRELEEKLAALEKNYQNKNPEQIRSTAFKVIVRGGNYDFIVVEQKLR
ncbi:MAG: hypothetical protein KF873_14125 [Gemmataceae bacterium]|nr:hypothetical protein [Gemmataceae bacterium]